jgi:hypothetical protein
VDDDAEIRPYSGPAGGWGSVKTVGAILTQEDVAILGSEILLKQNKTDGFACVSCCNGLIPLWHYAEKSKVPAAKSVPVRIIRDTTPYRPSN